MGSMDPTDQPAAKHVWLSYPEAVKALGVSLRAVEGRAYRGKWAKQRGNDGTVRLAVPRREIEAHTPHEPHGVGPMYGPTTPHAWGHDDHALKALERELETVREALARERERADQAMAEAATERSRAEEARVRAAAAEGKLEGLASGAALLHEQLAQMRREVAESHNRAVTAEQMVLDAVRQREGAEQALARARKWSFFNFVFGREGKGRQS